MSSNRATARDAISQTIGDTEYAHSFLLVAINGKITKPVCPEKATGFRLASLQIALVIMGI